jgi:hypothetical protein
MVAAVREALAEAVQRRFPSMQISPYVLAQPTLPCAFLFPGPTKYDDLDGQPVMHRGGDTWDFILRALIGDVGDIASQQQLDQLLEPSGVTSMKAAS